MYLKQTGEQIEQLVAAVHAGVAVDVRRLAHSCAGASATCGMSGIVPLLRELEKQGHDGVLTNAAELARQVETEFKRIRVYLETFLQRQAAVAAHN